VDTFWHLIGAAEQFVGAAKPDELAIEAEVQFEQATIEGEQEVFAVARGIKDVASAGKLCDLHRRLRFCCDGMKDVDATDTASTNKGTQAARYGFDFGKFGHGCSVA
jgi:hypothetical protein